ncbi:MAG: hypothetical protein LBN02_02815 [Oscillospiraceae bacterium]|jgi:hypothetical protein|nr:hypothetical protein [Oscillospiraceae bacterium]
MDLRKFGKFEGYAALSQLQQPKTNELRGDALDYHVNYAAKATDDLIFIAHRKGFSVVDLDGELVAGFTENGDLEFPAKLSVPPVSDDCDGNTLAWHLNSDKDETLSIEYAKGGATLNLKTPVSMSLKLKDFVSMRVADGVYFQRGKAGFGPVNGEIYVVFDFNKVLAVGAVKFGNELYPIGGWGRFVS